MDSYARTSVHRKEVLVRPGLLTLPVLGKLGDEENGVKAYEVLETYKGQDLEYKEYEPLYQCAYDCAAKQNKKAFYVTCDTYVTLTDGT